MRTVINPLCQWSFMAVKTVESLSEDGSVQTILTLLVPHIFTFLEFAAAETPQPFPLSYHFFPGFLFSVKVSFRPIF